MTKPDVVVPDNEASNDSRIIMSHNNNSLAVTTFLIVILSTWLCYFSFYGGFHASFLNPIPKIFFGTVNELGYNYFSSNR